MHILHFECHVLGRRERKNLDACSRHHRLPVHFHKPGCLISGIPDASDFTNRRS